MRNYGKVMPQFWTGRTGKEIRALGYEAQLVALYLLTCPGANMLGLYYIPLPVISHETGCPLKGATKALRRLSEAQFAHYDEDSEHVWVPAMARFQIGERLKVGDKLITYIARELLGMKSVRFVADFVEKYGAAYHLDTSPYWEALQRAMQAPSEPPRSQEMEMELEREQEQELERGVSRARARPAPTKTPAVKTLIPPDLALTDTMRAQIIAAGCTKPEAAFQTFCDHHAAKQNHYTDWQGAVWRTWVSSHGKYGCPCQGQPVTRNGRQANDPLENARRIAAKWEAEDREEKAQVKA